MLFGAFCSVIGNLTNFFLCKEKNCSNFAQTIWRRRTKFGRPDVSVANSLFLPPNHLTRLRKSALPIARVLSFPDWVCMSVERPTIHLHNLIPPKIVHISLSVKLLIPWYTFSKITNITFYEAFTCSDFLYVFLREAFPLRHFALVRESHTIKMESIR